MNEHTCTDADIYEIDGSACVSGAGATEYAEEYMSCGGSERIEECILAVQKAVDAFEAAADPAAAEVAAKACAKAEAELWAEVDAERVVWERFAASWAAIPPESSIDLDALMRMSMEIRLRAQETAAA